MPHDSRQTKISSFFSRDGASERVQEARNACNGNGNGNAAIALVPTTDPYRGAQVACTAAKAPIIQSHAAKTTARSQDPDLNSGPDSCPEPEDKISTSDKYDAEQPPAPDSETLDSSNPTSSTDTLFTTPHVQPTTPEASLPGNPPFSLRRITTNDLAPFKRLLTTLLPVSYPASFFTSIQTSASAFSRIAVWYQHQQRPQLGGPIVGGIKCRLEAVPALPNADGTAGPREAQLYIQALGVLAPYRRLGTAGAMLDEVLGEAGGQRGDEMGRIGSVYAHVWEANPEALEWYRGRGFVVEELVEEYYRRLKPGGAWLVRKKLG